MCLQANGILTWMAGHNAEFVQNIACSWVLGLAITAAVCFQVVMFLVSTMMVTSFASVASVLRQGPNGIGPSVIFNLSQLSYRSPSKDGLFYSLKRWIVLILVAAYYVYCWA